MKGKCNGKDVASWTYIVGRQRWLAKLVNSLVSGSLRLILLMGKTKTYLMKGCNLKPWNYYAVAPLWALVQRPNAAVSVELSLLPSETECIRLVNLD